MKAFLKRVIIFFLLALHICFYAKSNDNIDSVYSALLKKIEAADSNTDLKVFTTWISDALKCTDCMNELRVLLTEKIHDRSSIYSNRPYYTAARLKGYIIYQLSKAGITEESANIITGEVATSHDPYIIAASARALSTYIYKNKEIIPYLLKYLRPGFHDEWADIENFELSYPLISPTSVRLEVIKTLEANALETTEIMDALNAIAFAKEGSYFYNDSLLINAARTALPNIRNEKSCCSKSMEGNNTNWQLTESTFVSPWLAPEKRNRYLPAGIDINILNNKQTSFKKLKGKPLVMAFFYTRCTNPNKCSGTVTELGKLQQLLKQQSIDDAVNTALVSYDPVYDSPERITTYAISRGLQMDEHTIPMNISTEYLQDLVKNFEVEANYDAGLINIHEIQLLLFDKKNRFVRMYGQVVWNNNTLLEDIKKLTAE